MIHFDTSCILLVQESKNMGEKIGYIRVSTKEQNTARQDDLMKRLGVDRVYEEKISGKNMNRPQLKAMMDYVRQGDTVVVESYSRLARSTKDLLSIVDHLNEKGVAFVSQKEKVDTSTPQGRLMMTIFAGLAQFERECTLQRQAEGIAIAKSEGKYKGRQPIAKPSEWDSVYAQWKAGDITARVAQKKLSLAPATFYRMVKKYGSMA